MCPRRVLANDPAELPSLTRFWSAYQFLEADHVFPQTGGVQDQSAAFLGAVEIARHEANHIERERLRDLRNDQAREQASATSHARARHNG